MNNPLNMAEDVDRSGWQGVGRLYFIRGRLLITYGHLRCTAQARKRRHCKLSAEGYPSITREEMVAVQVRGAGWVHAREVDEKYADRLLAQRCEYHDTPDATDAALPDWETYDPGRHPGHVLGFPRQAAAAALAREASRQQSYDAEDAAPWAAPAALPYDPAHFAVAMRDTRLTWAARGVLATLAAGFLPGRTPSQEELERGHPEDPEVLDAALAELRAFGYIASGPGAASGDSRLSPMLAAVEHASLLRPPPPDVVPSEAIPAAMTAYESHVRGDLGFIANRTHRQPPETYGS